MNGPLVKHLIQICELVEEGKLPDTALPRYIYAGHKFLHSYYIPPVWKCIKCAHEWEGEESPCASCGAANTPPEYFIFDISSNREAKWECVACKHTWVGEDGETCPECGEVH